MADFKVILNKTNITVEKEVVKDYQIIYSSVEEGYDGDTITRKLYGAIVTLAQVEAEIAKWTEVKRQIEELEKTI